MRVEHFGGSVEVSNAENLCELLNARFGNDSNEFFISGNEPYPWIGILVRGSASCLHFFPTEDHPGFLSMGTEGAGGILTFYTNTPTEEIEITAEAVIPFDKAREAAMQFLHTGAMPTNIRWVEL